MFSWFEYPSKAVRDAANQKIASDPRMKQPGSEMPFDGRRMIYGGFASLFDSGARGGMGHVDGTLLAVPVANEEAYRAWVQRVAPRILSLGATRLVDAWGDDLPEGKVTDHRRAVKATGDETVVFSWIEWPSKEASDAAWPKIASDPDMRPTGALFDGQRMIHGGFEPIVDL